MKCRYEIRPLARDCKKFTHLRVSPKTIEVCVYSTRREMRKHSPARGRYDATTEGNRLAGSRVTARVHVTLECISPCLLAHEAYHAALRFRERIRLPATRSWLVREERMAYLLDSILGGLIDCVRRARREFNKRRKT